MHRLVLLKAGQGVVSARAARVRARVHRLPRVVHLLVVLQVVLPPKRAPANITAEGFRLRVDEDVAFELEFRGEFLVAA